MQKLSSTGLAIALGATLFVSACAPQGIQVPVTVPLGESTGTFTVVAGVSAENTGMVDSFDTGGITLGSGSLEIETSAIMVTETGTDAARLGSSGDGGTLTITVWIASTDDLDTVCGGGEQHGPYEVTLDANLTPVTISPSTFSLTENTLSLLNGGAFSLCVRVESTVDAIVSIDALKFNVGL